MSAKHTPGPWTVTRPPCASDELKFRVVSEATNLDVADLYWCDPNEHDTSQITADANLIAAAPDLLAACRRILVEDGGCSCSEGYCAWCLASAAIAKAEGRS